jgi:hypothetical protein
MSQLQSIFEEARLKLLRGQEHLDALESEFIRFRDSNPYTVVHEYDEQQRENRLRLFVTPPPQRRWGLILGDAVHNARTALDYITWILAGSDPADRSTLFPIYDDLSKFNSALWRLERLHPNAIITYIRSFQPYMRPNSHYNVLWFLQELDARDKHKLITMIEVGTAGARFTINDGDVIIPYAAIEERITHNTILAIKAGPSDPQMNVEFDFSFRVLFERGIISNTDDFDVRICLNKIFEQINVVINNFEFEVDRHPDWIRS